MPGHRSLRRPIRKLRGGGMKSGLHGRERLPKVLEREGVVANQDFHLGQVQRLVLLERHPHETGLDFPAQKMHQRPRGPQAPEIRHPGVHQGPLTAVRRHMDPQAARAERQIIVAVPHDDGIQGIRSLQIHLPPGEGLGTRVKGQGPLADARHRPAAFIGGRPLGGGALARRTVSRHVHRVRIVQDQLQHVNPLHCANAVSRL